MALRSTQTRKRNIFIHKVEWIGRRIDIAHLVSEKTIIVRARTPAFNLVGIRMVIIGIRLQTWMRVIVGVDV